MLLKPQTYMNDSGRSVGEAARFLKIEIGDIYVFHDEIDLAPGKLKVKVGGGNAGHNGLRSITAHIGNEYARVRAVGELYARRRGAQPGHRGRPCGRARAQGSRATPYKIAVELAPLTDDQWMRAIDAMAEQAIFAAKLLNGEMPPDIEEAFKQANVALFPVSGSDLRTSCSCPDYANPCKHSAAVYLLLGERFDADPFLLFHLRGRSKEQIMAAMRARRQRTLWRRSRRSMPSRARSRPMGRRWPSSLPGSGRPGRSWRISG